MGVEYLAPEKLVGAESSGATTSIANPYGPIKLKAREPANVRVKPVDQIRQIARFTTPRRAKEVGQHKEKAVQRVPDEDRTKELCAFGNGGKNRKLLCCDSLAG